MSYIIHTLLQSLYIHLLYDYSARKGATDWQVKYLLVCLFVCRHEFILFFLLGPFNGQWGDWESWGSCSKSDSKNMYGTGTHVRYRYCNNPPAMCGGDVCVGLNSQDGICRGK